ncbi:dihydrodipicolinate synthase family protein [Rubrobacter tropicus]|uniref:Dihydrodipicolinate synthase family protein n=1 Tax=Rubrobacter tropicus TaxID=2653851 RepID=A0A6G8Q670_9ACTN|nr:dihydrodipicolinate synthase family protein [Rubrobacter tropicus]QIN81929.1 dihydrodipicolinate synthase family protein [Rubrobacter tropicus]
MSLQGVLPITLTPFTDSGDVDSGGIEALTERYLDSGVDGLVALGIMGEAHKLTDAERSAVAGRYVAATDGKAPVVVGCSAPATRVAVERAREAEGLGAAAVMVAPPNNLKNLGLVFEHYREVAESVSVPVVVQDEPVNTGVVMPAAFISRVMNEVQNCRYVKLEEAPTTIKISALTNGIESADKRAGIFGGLGGMYFYEELGRGAIGIMTGFAYPEILVRVYYLYSKGREMEAREHFFRYLPLIRFEAQLGVGGVGIRKEVFKMRRVIASSHVRSPAPPLDAETLRELEDLVEYLGLTEGDTG